MSLDLHPVVNITPLTTVSPFTCRVRFLADSMMSRLGRWMRALGIDVEIWSGDRNFFEIALAALKVRYNAESWWLGHTNPQSC